MSAQRTEEHRGKLLSYPNRPPIVVSASASLGCDCTVYVGRRIDTGEVASAACPCCPEHLRLIKHFNLLLKESLVEPGDGALIDVVADLLDEAERHWQGAPR